MAAGHARIVDRVTTRLKLKQLRLLVAVGKHGNIQYAARDLNISQPSATKMIQDLELDFEVQLFERTNRGVVPTPFGETLIRHGKLIFAQISNAAQELDDLNEGNSGRVVIGTLLAASPHLLPLAIVQALQERPRLAIKVVEGTNEVLIPNLRSGEIDLIAGRLTGHGFHEELKQEKLFDERILLVVGPHHPLAGKKGVEFSDLKEFGWILPPFETTLRRQIEQYFLKQNQYHPPFCLESVSYLTNRSLLRAKNYIGLMPSHVASQDIKVGLLATLDLDLPFGNSAVGISYRRSGEMSPAGQAMLQSLRRTGALIS